MRHYLTLCLFMVFPGLVVAQNLRITGTVKEQSGVGIPGVTLRAENSKATSITDANGAFSILVSENDALTFSAIGYATQRQSTSGRNIVNIILQSSQEVLDEVVVVGYGTERKRDVSGAVSSIGAAQINERRVVQVTDALQGAIAGVTVTRSSGEPGSSSAIRFRGITTIGNNNPLFIVDGVPYNDIDRLNPSDIESITALKDAASASIYGSRAAAGVLLITTKRAKTGQTSVDYNYEFGVQNATSLPKYAGIVDYLTLYNEYATNDGAAALYAQSFIDNYLENNALKPDEFPNTNWQDAILKNNAPRQMHDLAFTVGTDKLKTRVSLGYSDSKALYANNKFQKLSGRINNDMKFTDRLSANVDLFLIRTNDYSTTSNPFSNARILPPIYDDFYSDGRFAPGKEGTNPLAEIMEGGYSNDYISQIQGRGSLTYKVLEGLTLTGIAAPNYTNNRLSTWNKRINFTDVNDPSRVIYFNSANTTLKESRPYGYTLNTQFLANFSRKIRDNHNIDILAGYEDNYSFTENLSASRGAYVLTDYPYLDNGSLALRDNSGNATESALRSFFGRAKYNYKDKYHLQANLRYDGSSKFSADSRWALFPSFSGAWTLSEEKFLKSLDFISFMKLRGSWGQVGNERIGSYPYQASITFNDALFYNNGAVIPVTSGAQTSYAVADISWETQETVDLGLDVNFLKNRLTVSADYYEKTTRDILLSLDIPVYLGYDKPSQNAGTVSSKGWELTANWNHSIGEVKYAVGFNLSDAKTKIVDLKGTQQLGSKANIQGGEFNEWYGYRSSGLFQKAADLVNAPVLNANTKAGDVRYIDQDGDGKITPDKDQVLLGGSLPRYTFGFNARAEVKRLELSFVIQGVAKQLNSLSTGTGVSPVLPFNSSFGNVPAIIQGKHWSPNNTPEQNEAAIYPRLSRISSSNNYLTSDFWLIDGAYMRVKNVTLAYSLPEKLFNKTGLKGLRVYIAGNDLLTFSHFPKGSDPENTGTSYPITRTVFAGLNVKF